MYSFNSRIRYSEVDEERKLCIPTLLDYFQDASTFQSEELGIGIDYLGETDQAWVVSVYQIDIMRLPKLMDEVKICTAPYKFRGCLGYRNYWMLDEKGEYLAKASSLWTLLNMKTLTPTKPTQKLLDAYELEEPLDMEYLPRKIDYPQAAQAMTPITVQRHHLDSNHHVNNVEYVRMALEQIPEETRVNRIRVNFKGQAHLGDIILPYLYVERIEKDTAPEGDSLLEVLLSAAASYRYVVALVSADGETFAEVEVV